MKDDKTRVRISASPRTKALMIAYAVLSEVPQNAAVEFYALMMLGTIGALSRPDLSKRFKRAVDANPLVWKKVQKAMYPDGELFRLLKEAIASKR